MVGPETANLYPQGNASQRLLQRRYVANTCVSMPHWSLTSNVALTR